MDPDSRSLRNTLERGLVALGQDAAQADRWASLALLIERWGRRLNLTGHEDAVSIAQRLLLEAAALERVLPEADTIADLGSGAGIPGLPIALCRPQARVWLVDSRERRHHFQRAAIRELALGNVEALHGRAEELEPIRCTGVISQAFAQPERAIAWMLPWSTDSGWLALATTPEFAPPAHLQLDRGALWPYAAPDGPVRALWVASRRRSASGLGS